MFNIGDKVEFWMADGYKYRHGVIVRKEYTTCYIRVNYDKIRRIHKIKEKYLQVWKGIKNADRKKKHDLRW